MQGGWMLTRLVIILQCIKIWNHYVIYLKLICYVSYFKFFKLKKKKEETICLSLAKVAEWGWGWTL